MMTASHNKTTTMTILLLQATTISQQNPHNSGHHKAHTRTDLTLTRIAEILRFSGWPAIAGVLLGTVILLWNDNHPKHQTPQSDLGLNLGTLSPKNGGWTGTASYASAVQRATPSVVNIYTLTKQERAKHPLSDDPLFRHFFNNANTPQQERMESALGSGVIISTEGYILTNNHVIADADEIVVLLTDGREAKATQVGSDPESDLAVLKIELANLTAISIGDPAIAKVGDVVLAIGNPFGVGQTVTQGIISATGRYGLGINTYENYLQTDAAINPGNSGGALIDAYGNLLGINTAILDKTGYSVGIGFAIPADTAVKATKDLVQHGEVIRGWLGIEAQQLDIELAQSFNIQTEHGVIITAIYNNGPAHKIGLRAGDIIIRLNQQMVSNGQLSVNQIGNGKPGDKVIIDFLRNSEPMTVTATLGKKPSL